MKQQEKNLTQQGETMNIEDKKSSLPVIAAIVLLVATSIYLYAKAIGNRKYIRKWEDYDECGIF
jgi:hypothetical protein